MCDGGLVASLSSPPFPAFFFFVVGDGSKGARLSVCLFVLQMDGQAVCVHFDMRDMVSPYFFFPSFIN